MHAVEFQCPLQRIAVSVLLANPEECTLATQQHLQGALSAAGDCNKSDCNQAGHRDAHCRNISSSCRQESPPGRPQRRRSHAHAADGGVGTNGCGPRRADCLNHCGSEHAEPMGRLDAAETGRPGLIRQCERMGGEMPCQLRCSAGPEQPAPPAAVRSGRASSAQRAAHTSPQECRHD